MSVVTITYNNQDLSDILEIHDIKRNIGNNREVSTNSAPKLGVSLTGVKTSEKKISVEFSIYDRDRNTLKHRLAGLFNVSEPKKLIFSDEPDKYYLALVEGEVAMSESDNFRSTGSLTFLIPDGVAHSSTYKRLTSDGVTASNGKMTFSVVNKGNVEAYPIVKVSHRAENGYIGLINQLGAFEIGQSVQESNQAKTLKMQGLLNLKSALAEALRLGRSNIAIKNYAVAYGTTVANANQFLQPANASQIGVRNNVGSGLSWVMPSVPNGTDLFEESVWANVTFPGSNFFGGFTTALLVTDLNNEVLYGLEISVGNLSTIQVKFLIKRGSSLMTAKEWSYNSYSDVNPFNEGGAFELKRNKSSFSLNFNGSSYNFEIPELASVKTEAVHLIFKDSSYTRISKAYGLSGLVVKKNFETTSATQAKAGMLFSAGSELVVDSESDTVILDGVLRNGEIIDGSDWLSLPVGTSELSLLYSPSATRAPDVTIEFEERWI